MSLSNDEVRHKHETKYEYLEFSAFDKYSDKITAAFAIRGENNVDYGYDAPDENFSGICKTLNIGYEKLSRIERQVHGRECYVIKKGGTRVSEGCDALLTNVPGVPLMIRIADCITIFIYDPVNNAIADVHSGWKGTLLNISDAAVKRMIDEYGSSAEDLVCVLCPSLLQDCFEVRNDVKDQFEEKFGTDFIDPIGNEKYLIDAPSCVRKSLIDAGVKYENIHLSNICTMCNRDKIHSYRGNIECEKHYRNAAIICLK